MKHLKWIIFLIIILIFGPSLIVCCSRVDEEEIKEESTLVNTQDSYKLPDNEWIEVDKKEELYSNYIKYF